ncbi:hypothetical protein [Pseudorhodoferax sp.]|uniref:hypothetical protein n=1 Tax=Pseudorhodoferax sp. TaxID=1993553 RepID=UPI002DD6AE64|nr:hypothetical protein [Pseudorhodoferax sp.]
MAPLSPGEQPRGAPVRWARVLGVVLLLVLAGTAWLWARSDPRADEYLRYFSESHQPAHFAFGTLSEQWTEATLAERFAGHPVSCHAYRGSPRADRACAVRVHAHNGVPTLFIAFFFGGGRLQQVSVNIPWWSLETAQRSLVDSMGPPQGVQDQPHGGVRLVGWPLPDGAALFVNRDRDANPLVWNAIQWFSPALCAAGCFTGRPDTPS